MSLRTAIGCLLDMIEGRVADLRATTDPRASDQRAAFAVVTKLLADLSEAKQS